MLAALIIVFREVLEAGLVVGVVLAATRGVPHRAWYVTAGVFGGVVGASIVAAFAGQISNMFGGSGQELLNAAVLAIAVLMLGWTVVWMSAHGRQMTAELKAVGRDVAEGRKPLTALAIVVGTAVLREGFEVVLFLYGVIASGGTSSSGIVAGGALGILAGVAVAGVLYLGLVSIPLKHVFDIIAVLITLLRAGLAAQAIGFLQSAGYAGLLSAPLWDTSGILSEDSILGRVLHTLVGYLAQPSGLQLIAYALTIIVIIFCMRHVHQGQARLRAGVGR